MEKLNFDILKTKKEDLLKNFNFIRNFVFESLADFKNVDVKLAEFFFSEDDIKKINDRFNKILYAIDKYKIDVAVIGQVKYGKSTLLNALVFGGTVLPVSVIPESASITKIVYSDEEDKKHKAKITFLNKPEYKKIVYYTNRSDDSEFSDRINDYVNKLRSNLRSLSKINIDEYIKDENHSIIVDWRDLEKYVSAFEDSDHPKFYTIVKEVEVYSENPILKNFNLVDTPGINDVDLEREMRTKKYISRVDAVILLLSLSNILTEEDMAIIEKNLGGNDIRKILPLANFITYESPDDIDKIIADAIRKIEIKKNSIDQGSIEYVIYDNILKNGITKVDGLFAMIGHNWEEMRNDPDCIEFIEKHHVTSAEESLRLSNLNDVIKKIELGILNEDFKLTSLFIKPVDGLISVIDFFKFKFNSIDQNVNYLIEEIDKKTDELENEIKFNEKILKKFNEIGEPLNSLKTSINNNFHDFLKRQGNKLIKISFDKIDNIFKIFESKNFFLDSSVRSAIKFFEYEFSNLLSPNGELYNDLTSLFNKYFSSDFGNKSNNKFYLLSSKDIILKYFKDNFDKADLCVKRIVNAIDNISVSQLLNIEYIKFEHNSYSVITNLTLMFINNKVNVDLLRKQLEDFKIEIENEVKTYINKYNEYAKRVVDYNVDLVSETVKKTFNNQINGLKEIISDKNDKNNKINNKKYQLDKINKSVNSILADYKVQQRKLLSLKNDIKSGNFFRS